jgi:hypothetical protein
MHGFDTCHQSLGKAPPHDGQHAQLQGASKRWRYLEGCAFL